MPTLALSTGVIGWSSNTTTVAAAAISAAAAAASNWSLSAAAGAAGGGAYEPALRCSIEHVECRASQWLYTVMCPLMLATGTVGNTLCILVMTSRDLRRTAFGVYVASLAAVDLLAIWSALVRHFVKAVWLFDVRSNSVWSCRIHRYLVYSSIDSSAWILVALTTGRLVSIRFPEGSRRHRGAARAHVIVPLIVAAQLVFNLPTFWMLGDQQMADGSVNHCGYPDAASERYWREVQPYASMTEASILPFVLMLAMNVTIVVLLRRRSGDAHSVYRRSRQEQGLSGSSDAKTVMLLVVSFVFLVSTVPTFINTAIEALLDVDKTSADKARVELVDTLTTLLLYTNGANNFFLYCLTGRTFRRHCIAALARLRDRALGRAPANDRRYSSRPCSLSALPRDVVALRDASVWTSSAGSSPADTPRSSPGSLRSPLASAAATLTPMARRCSR